MSPPPLLAVLGRLGCLILFVALACNAAAGPKVGLLMKDRGIFWKSLEAGAADELKRAGGTLIVKAPLVSSNTRQQLALLNLLAAEDDLDALLIGPLELEEFTQPLAELRARGVKVVVIDTPIAEDATADVCIGYDQVAMARDAARAFAELAGPTDEYAVLHIVSYDVTVVREREFIGALREIHPQAVISVDRDSTSRIHDDYHQCCRLLDNHPNARAMATLYTGSSLDMIRAIKTKGRSGTVKLLGFGSGLPKEVVDAIKDGQLHVWVAQLPRDIGRVAAGAVLDLLAGRPVPKLIVPEYFIVTRKNLSDPKIQEHQKE